MSDGTINRKYKDRLFIFIFGKEENKAWTLELYNALNGSNYSDCNDIEIVTLEDVLYMGMKNDVSFIAYDSLNLYEEQSSFCPNMPVRSLMYLGRQYDKYIKQNKLNIYGEKQLKLPVPRLLTFYNGKKDLEDRILTLSDAFENDTDALKSDVEVRVHMLNINIGHNKELLNSCKPLMEYSWFIEEIRQYEKSMPLEAAIDAALDSMPDIFKIKEYLEGNRAEVKSMCLTEYNEEEVIEMFKRDAREEGIKEGLKAGEAKRQKLLEENARLRAELAKITSSS